MCCGVHGCAILGKMSSNSQWFKGPKTRHTHWQLPIQLYLAVNY